MGTETETSLALDDQQKALASVEVKELAFDRLPEAVQTRLLDSLVKNLSPQPLLSLISRKPFSAGPWRIVAVCAFLVSPAFWIEGFGLRRILWKLTFFVSFPTMSSVKYDCVFD